MGQARDLLLSCGAGVGGDHWRLAALSCRAAPATADGGCPTAAAPTTRAGDPARSPWPRRAQQRCGTHGPEPASASGSPGRGRTSPASGPGAPGARQHARRPISMAALPGNDSLPPPTGGRAEPAAPPSPSPGPIANGGPEPVLSAGPKRHPLDLRREGLQSATLARQTGNQRQGGPATSACRWAAASPRRRRRTDAGAAAEAPYGTTPVVLYSTWRSRPEGWAGPDAADPRERPEGRGEPQEGPGNGR